MRTVDLARASDSHPNTVRLYEEWGFIPKAERASNGYRLWSREHLDQMIFARLALDGFWPGRPIRKSALALVRLAATGDLRAALAAAEAHLVAPLKIAGGLAASVKAAAVTYSATKLSGGGWFPCVVDLRLEGRQALLFRLDTAFRFEFSGFASFSVETESEVGPPSVQSAP